MSVIAWRRLVASAAETDSISQRIRLWLEAIDQPPLIFDKDQLTAFSPPESSGIVDSGGVPAAQVYALGVLGYALLTGAVPWQEASGADLRHKILTARLPAISHSDFSPVFLGRINRIIAHATEKDPAARFSTPDLLKTELISAVTPQKKGPHGASSLPRIHHETYQRIEQWLHRAREGTASVLTVVGASGIGKTYLWETVHDTHATGDERWLYVKAGQAIQRPYETVVQLLERNPEAIGGLLHDERISQSVKAFVKAIAPHLVSMDITADASEVRDPARELARVIGRIRGASRLLVVCFDDFQWIDSYSRQVCEELARGPEPVALVTLSREVVNLNEPQHREYLNPLNREEALEFAQSLEPITGSITPKMFDDAFRISGGNPMGLSAVLRDGTRLSSTDSRDVLTAVAFDRVSRLSPGCRSLVLLMALVGTPTSVSMILRTGEFAEEDLDSFLIEGEEASLLRRSRLHNSVRFAHDSIEAAARREAELDSQSRRQAVRALIADARRGNDRSAYRAIGLLAAFGSEDVSEGDMDWVTTAAARRAVLSLAPEEALRIVAEWHGHVSVTARRELYLIAHEAAYLRGDRGEMSRYYRAIATIGDAEATIEARYMWIRRCYADTRFRGAVAVGVRILATSAIIDEPLTWSADEDDLMRRLQHNPPKRVLQVILRRGYTSDRAVRRATDTLARLFLPVLTTDRSHLSHVAYYTLRIAMERGATPLTGIGFIAWAVFLGTRRVPGRWVAEFMECAQQLSAHSGDRWADHSIRTLIAAFGGPWTRSYREFSDELELLQQEGREIGNTEFLAHALHIQRQTLLYRGDPLSHVRELVDESRREVRSYGLVRTDTALAKHHAITEVLLGNAEDPTRMDGAIVREREYLARILESDDQISLAGFRTTKAFLALYGDRPDMVFDELTTIEEVLPAISLFHENLMVRFYLGIVAYRLDRPEVGARMLRLVHRWTRENPRTSRHRLLGIRAERAAFRGRPTVARRLLSRAIPLAIEAGFMNEAALLAERAGDIRADPQFWMVAESGYRQWGAVHAVSRVNHKLGRRDSPSIRDAFPVFKGGIHADLTATASLDDLTLTVARHLFETTSAVEVVISVESGTTVAGSVYEWDGTSPRYRGSASADLSLVLTETAAGEFRMLSDEELLRRETPGVSGRSQRVDTTELAALVLGAEGGAAYKDSVVPALRTILAAGAQHAARISAVLRVQQIEHQLEEARQQLGVIEKYRRQLFSTVTDAFVLMDRAGFVRFSNPAAEPFLDHRSAATLLRDDLRGAVNELIAPIGPVPRGRVRCSLSDGRHVEIQAAPVESEPEDVVTVSIADISDAVNREMQLAQQERQLIVADRLASIGMFSASIVHEISNPNHILQLNTQSLLVVLEWLRDQVDDEHASATVAQAGELVGQIEDAARRVEAVLQMVKSYSREGRRERWGVLAADEICSRAFRFSQIMASQYTDRFRLVVADGVLPIWGEAALLEQAVINLIKNACEALTGRTGRVELHAYSTDDGTETILAVCDTGSGFPPGRTDHLGVPFLSGRHETGGTGLGLSIVSGIVDKHRGYLRVTNDELFITRMEVHLPVHTSQTD